MKVFNFVLYKSYDYTFNSDTVLCIKFYVCVLFVLVVNMLIKIVYHCIAWNNAISFNSILY